MPLFDVRCKRCGRKTYDIAVNGSSDRIIQKCPCGSDEFEKLPPVVSTRFKGDGWATPRPTGGAEEE